mgnify:CR=1 FL=1
MKSFVSVIVPIYNTEKYLPKCLDSIIGQTYPNLQIILVDDGSTDNSGRICDEYAKNDQRVRVFHRKNSGLVASRKFGLSVATGEYIAWVDSDDWIARDAYKQMLEEAVFGGFDIVYCHTWLVYKDYSEIRPLYEQSPSNMIRHMLRSRTTLATSLCNKFIRRSFYNSINIKLYVGDDIWEDFFQMIQLFNANPKVGFVRLPLYFYNRANDQSMVNSCNNIQLKAINNAKHIHDFLVEKNVFEEYRTDFACLAMLLKIAVLHDRGITAARVLFPYAHRLRSVYPMSNIVSWIYWIGFSGGRIGEWIFNLYDNLNKWRK